MLRKEKSGARNTTLQRGQGLVEYALILMLVGIVVIVVLAVFGERVKATYCAAVTTIAPGVEAPACELGLDVSCVITSDDPFKLEAVVKDTIGENNIQRVVFYVDGVPYNTQKTYHYCLEDDKGDGTCKPFSGAKGEHTFSAVAYDVDGNTGKCSVKATVH